MKIEIDDINIANICLNSSVYCYHQYTLFETSGGCCSFTGK